MNRPVEGDANPDALPLAPSTMPQDDYLDLVAAHVSPSPDPTHLPQPQPEPGVAVEGEAWRILYPVFVGVVQGQEDAIGPAQAA